MNIKKYFSLLPRTYIESLSDDELRALRKKSLWQLTIIIVSAIILIELALWYRYDTIWPVLFIVTIIVAIPQMISSSRLSSEYFKRKKPS